MSRPRSKTRVPACVCGKPSPFGHHRQHQGQDPGHGSRPSRLSLRQARHRQQHLVNRNRRLHIHWRLPSPRSTYEGLCEDFNQQDHRLEVESSDTDDKPSLNLNLNLIFQPSALTSTLIIACSGGKPLIFGHHRQCQDQGSRQGYEDVLRADLLSSDTFGYFGTCYYPYLSWTTIHSSLSC